MKKTIRVALAIALSVVMVLGIVACGPGGGGGGGGGGGTTAPATAPGHVVAVPAPVVVDPGVPEDEELVQTRTTPLTLTFAHASPATHAMNVGAVMPFVEAFMEATEGMVEVIVHPGGSLTSPQTLFDDVTIGAIDMTYGTAAFTPGRYRLLEIMELPMTFVSGTEAVDVAWDMIENNPDFAGEYANFKIFALFSTPTAQLWTQDTPLRVPADLHGHVLRVPSAMAERSIQAAGGATAQMPIMEAYDSLDRGVVSGMGLDYAGIAMYSLWDVLDYGIENLHQYISMQMMAMSWDAWDKLNDFEKAAFDRLSGRTLSHMATDHFQATADYALETMKTEGHVEMIYLTPEERAQWEAVYAPVAQDYIDTLTAAGLNAQEVREDILRFRDERRAGTRN